MPSSKIASADQSIVAAPDYSMKPNADPTDPRKLCTASKKIWEDLSKDLGKNFAAALQNAQDLTNSIASAKLSGEVELPKDLLDDIHLNINLLEDFSKQLPQNSIFSSITSIGSSFSKQRKIELTPQDIKDTFVQIRTNLVVEPQDWKKLNKLYSPTPEEDAFSSVSEELREEDIYHDTSNDEAFKEFSTGNSVEIVEIPNTEELKEPGTGSSVVITEIQEENESYISPEIKINPEENKTTNPLIS